MLRRAEHAKRKNVMGFPAGVLQVQRCEQDLNAPQFVLLSFSQSRQCSQRHNNNHLCKQQTLDL